MCLSPASSTHLGISKLTEGQEGFSAGDRPHVYPVAGAPAVTPLICYEMIFPDAVTEQRIGPAGWSISPTIPGSAPGPARTNIF